MVTAKSSATTGVRVRYGCLSDVALDFPRPREEREGSLLGLHLVSVLLTF